MHKGATEFMTTWWFREGMTNEWWWIREGNRSICKTELDIVLTLFSIACDFPFCQKFVCFYLFFYCKLFLPMNTHPLTHVPTFAMLLLHVSSPFILFHFHHSHQVQTIRNTSKVDLSIYWRQEYLLARLLGGHLLPPDTMSQGFAKWQLLQPLLQKLMMRLYILRYWVQGDSWRQRWDEEVIGGGIRISTRLSNLGETSWGADDRRSLM